MSGRISFVIDTDDKATLGSVAQALLFMAGMSAAAVVAELRPVEQPTLSVVEEVLREAERVNELNTCHPPVNTAAVFGGAPIEPSALVEPVTLTPAPLAPPAPPAPLAAATPPTPPAPPAPAAPPAPPVVAQDLDKSGLPWDARVNTANKEKTQKGIFKRKPKLTDDEYNAVINELKAVMALGAAQPAAPAPTAPPAPPAPQEPVNYSGAQSGGYQPAAPAPGASEEAPTTYNGLLQAITPHLTAKRISSDEINFVCVQNGLLSLTQAANAPQLIPAIYDGCKAIWSTRA